MLLGMRGLAIVALLLVLAGPREAQAERARELARRAAEAEPGSPSWFQLGFERVEAELRSDVRAAVALADELVEAARARSDPAWLAAAAAHAALAHATLEGPHAARELDALSSTPLAPDAPAWLRARHALARSRHLCQSAQPADELAAALEGYNVAREVDDLALRTLAALVADHVTRDSAETFYADLRAELRALAEEPANGSFHQRFALLEYYETEAEHTRDERLARLVEIEALARAQGDRATLGELALARAALAYEAGDIEEGLRQHELAAEEFRQLGSLRDQAYALETAADLVLTVDDVARARPFLDRASALIEGRGFTGREDGILRSRFGVAMVEKDSATILALTEKLEAIEAREEEEMRAYIPLRDRLLSAERKRVEAERALASGQEELARNRAETRRLVLAGFGLTLVLLTVLALRSRQGLLKANVRLASEVERAEREAAARRALEERMRQLERSESLGLVAGGVAHDFNNLMVGVLGNADLLLLREQDPARRELLQAISSSGQRAARLCRQLQTFAGEEPLAKEPLCLAQLVRELLPVLRTAAGEGVTLALAVGVELPGVVGDRTALEQAVLNLVTNARDAGARRIELTVRRLALAPQDLETGHFRGEVGPGEFLCLAVQDDGEGMPAEHLERIFDPFFTTRFPGRGLGLAVVFGAVRRHGGLIRVESRPGAGSCFRLCLPLAGERVQPAARSAPLALATVAPLDVLAVDDEAPVRAFIEAALGERGHRVRVRADGRDLAAALEDFERPARAVLLLDLTLPGQDGRDLARAARRAHPQLPLVLMSGHAAPQITELARELGARGWVQKPFGVAELEGALARALEPALGAAGGA